MRPAPCRSCPSAHVSGAVEPMVNVPVPGEGLTTMSLLEEVTLTDPPPPPVYCGMFSTPSENVEGPLEPMVVSVMGAW